MIAEVTRKLIRKLYTVVQVRKKCAVRCIGSTNVDAGIEDVREISTHPSPLQLQDRFIVQCILQSNGWGVRRITKGKIVWEMDLPPSPIVESFSRAVEKMKVLLNFY